MLGKTVLIWRVQQSTIVEGNQNGVTTKSHFYGHYLTSQKKNEGKFVIIYLVRPVPLPVVVPGDIGFENFLKFL